MLLFFHSLDQFFLHEKKATSFFTYLFDTIHYLCISPGGCRFLWTYRDPSRSRSSSKDAQPMLCWGSLAAIGIGKGTPLKSSELVDQDSSRRMPIVCIRHVDAVSKPPNQQFAFSSIIGDMGYHAIRSSLIDLQCTSIDLFWYK